MRTQPFLYFKGRCEEAAELAFPPGLLGGVLSSSPRVQAVAHLSMARSRISALPIDAFGRDGRST
jgi:hypothetical protein